MCPQVLMYLGLASGNRKNHTPFSLLHRNVHNFIAPQYLPASGTVIDPWNMKLANIVEFCDHVRQRQEEEGVMYAFRFH